MWPALHRHLSKSWVQWLLAVVIFFGFSWFYMGSALTSCSTASTAMGSDSTGGFGWIQWAGGNDLTWGHTVKSNYPFGETLGKPLYITSSIFIGIFKVFASLTTPICGLNLMVLLGYMSSALLMFGLVKWLLKRFDIALFAGYAAAFVPFHILKSESHITYMFSSIFIAAIWAYLWFINRPSYRRALLLAVVGSLGFYFDGYFVLFSSVLMGTLLASSFVWDAVRFIFRHSQRKEIWQQALQRLRYVLVTGIAMAVILTPILVTYVRDGSAINQSLASVRSDILTETEVYGTRPIELVLPSYTSALLPASYPAWRATKLHGSNYSESTLYIGYTVIILALAGLIFVAFKKWRRLQLEHLTYDYVMYITVLAFIACFVMSLPPKAFIDGHLIDTPGIALIKVTSNWRVLSRFVLAFDPLAILAASLGLYVITRQRSTWLRFTIVALCAAALFLEYLPAPLHANGDLYKNAPVAYKDLAADKSVKLVAEYPLANFTYSPEIFTYQMMHNKTLVNANDGSISRGPFDASIAGLNDIQTAGALKQLGVDVIITHGFADATTALVPYYRLPPAYNSDGTINQAATMYAYKLSPSVVPRTSILIIKKGYESLSVDTKQISHRFITNDGTFDILNLGTSRPAGQYVASFDLQAAACPLNATVTVTQAGRTLWRGSVTNARITHLQLPVQLRPFDVTTANCSVDVTNLSATAVH